MVRKLLMRKDDKSSPKKGRFSPEEMRKLIEKRAYEVYCRRGNTPGDPLNDWIVAEKEISLELRISK